MNKKNYRQPQADCISNKYQSIEHSEINFFDGHTLLKADIFARLPRLPSDDSHG